MSRRQTQKDKVLAHLKQYGMITPLDALRQYGCFRLGAVIHTLRHEEGYDIKTSIAKGNANYAIYSLTNNPCNIDDEFDEAADQMELDSESNMYKVHEPTEEKLMDYDYETKYDKSDIRFRTSMEQAANAEDPNKMQEVKDRLWDKGFKYIGKGPKATQDKSNAEVPETINMFEQIADNVHREINPNEKVKAKIESNKKLTDAELIANEVKLIKEQGFMDYLKGTMCKKRGSK